MSESVTIRETSIAWRDAEEWFRSVPEARTTWIETCWDTAYEASSDGERVGLLLVDTTSPSSAYLLAVAVAKEMRNAGVGSALVDRALEGHESVYCDVRKGNEAGLALAESAGLTIHQGFQPSGGVVRYSTSEDRHEQQVVAATDGSGGTGATTTRGDAR